MKSDGTLAAVALLLLLAGAFTALTLLCEGAEACEMRVMDTPVVKYPQTRECAVHGSTVVLAFGDERYEVRPTKDELAYGMRWSREP